MRSTENRYLSHDRRLAAQPHLRGFLWNGLIRILLRYSLDAEKILAISGSIAVILLFQGIIYFGVDANVVEELSPSLFFADHQFLR